MATELTMPKSGHLMEEGTVVSWKKKIGDSIKKGDIVLEVEADKGVFEVESPYNGKLSKILVKEQETVPVSTALALIEEA